MQFKGVVKKVIEKTFAKRDGSGNITTYEIVVEEPDGEYPQSGVFELKKNVSIPAEGESVTVTFNMRTSEWEGKFFGKNQAWKVESERLDNTPVGSIPQPTQYAPEAAEGSATGSGNDDLPF